MKKLHMYQINETHLYSIKMEQLGFRGLTFVYANDSNYIITFSVVLLLLFYYILETNKLNVQHVLFLPQTMFHAFKQQLDTMSKILVVKTIYYWI